MASLNVSPINNTQPQAINKVSRRDKEIQHLFQQKTKINEQINEIRANEKLNDEIKRDRIKSLNESIQQIEAQIAQIKLEEMEEKNKKNKPEAPKENPANQQQDPSLDKLNALLQVGQSYNNLGKLISMRNQKTGQIRTIEGDVKSDRMMLEINDDKDLGKSMMAQNAEMTVFQNKRDEVLEITTQLYKVHQKIGDILNDINETVSKPITAPEPPTDPTQVDEQKDDQHNTTNTEKKTDSPESQTPIHNVEPSIDIRV